MRVIAGTYGGRTLKAPPGDGTRPTSDRVRESLFSILGDRTRESRVLDLFAGSGALGLEALSRGAAEVTFVDSSPAAVRAVRANLEALEAGADVRRADARAFLRNARAAGRQYDLVFLDPPYQRAGALAEALAGDLAAVLAPRARVVAESDRRSPLELPLALQVDRRYGDTVIRIFTA
jgi:16S rRNA (guanine966-N2)-methyltransferase